MNQTLFNRIKDHVRGLFRDPENGQILGVCAGLAEVYQLNPLAVRVVAVALLVSVPIMTGCVYLILAVMLPDKSRRNASGLRSRRFAGSFDDDVRMSR